MEAKADGQGDGSLTPMPASSSDQLAPNLNRATNRNYSATHHGWHSATRLARIAAIHIRIFRCLAPFSAQRTADAGKCLPKHMGINLCGTHIGVPQQRLHRTDITAPAQQLGGERMPEGVATGWLGQATRLY